MMNNRFANRSEAGKALAKKLKHYAYHPDVVVLALPRGGVPVAFEVAEHLHLPLDIFVVRKLGVPGHEEFAMGAIASGGVYFLNPTVIAELQITHREIQDVIARETREIERREQEYRPTHRVDVHGKTVILVDDGLATGSTMRAAVSAIKQQEAHKVVIAVPVAPLEVFNEFQEEGEEIVAVLTPEMFFAVGEWYEDFEQTSDEEVRDLLRKSEAHLQESTSKPVVL